MTDKPTKGTWTRSGNHIIAMSGTIAVVPLPGRNNIGVFEYAANTRLIAEAGTVHNETGKTPRQLANENAALIEALEYLLQGCIYDSPVPLDILVDHARDVLARVKGEKP